MPYNNHSRHSIPAKKLKIGKSYRDPKRTKFDGLKTVFNRLLGTNVPVVQSRQVRRRVALLEAKVDRQMEALRLRITARGSTLRKPLSAGDIDPANQQPVRHAS